MLGRMGRLLARAVRRLNDLPEPTAAGRITLLFLLAGFWLPVAHHNNPALFVFCAALATVLLSAVVTHFAPGRLTVERELPRRVFAGEAFDVRLRLTNRSRWRPALGVGFRDALQADDPGDLVCGAEVPVVPPGGTVEISYRKRLHRRGVRTVESALVATRFPFGLFEKRVLLPGGRSRVVVLPAPGRLLREADRDLAAPATRPRPRPLREDGVEEFHGIHEFRPGDNPRHIHWKTSARTRRLMRRVMDDERGGDLVVLLDTCVAGLDAQDRRRSLETAVSCAATLLLEAARRGSRAVVRFPGGEAGHGGNVRGALLALETLARVQGGAVPAGDLAGRERGGVRRALLLSLRGPAAEARAAAARRGVDLRVWDMAGPGLARCFRRR